MIEIQNIVGVTDYSGSYSKTETKTNELGKDSFLTLMLAQLENQDPLNPMDSTEFTAQLAQYTSLEQLYNVNQNLENIKGSQDQSTRFQALDIMGKEVLMEGSSLVLGDDQTARGCFTVESEANCTASIYDSEGILVDSVFLGAHGPGEHSFEWDAVDGTGNEMVSGNYYFEISAVDEDGFIVPAETRINGKVTRVNLENGTPVLYVGGLAVSLSQILDVRLPKETNEDPGSY